MAQEVTARTERTMVKMAVAQRTKARMQVMSETRTIPRWQLLPRRLPRQLPRRLPQQLSRRQLSGVSSQALLVFSEQSLRLYGGVFQETAGQRACSFSKDFLSLSA